MSHTSIDAYYEQEWAINHALNTRDSEALFALAQELKEQGDDEGARELLETAKRIEREDNYHDQQQEYV